MQYYGCGCERPSRFGHDRLCPRYRSQTQQIADLESLTVALRDVLDIAERERIAVQRLTDVGRMSTVSGGTK